MVFHGKNNKVHARRKCFLQGGSAFPKGPVSRGKPAVCEPHHPQKHSANPAIYRRGGWGLVAHQAKHDFASTTHPSCHALPPNTRNVLSRFRLRLWYRVYLCEVIRLTRNLVLEGKQLKPASLPRKCLSTCASWRYNEEILQRVLSTDPRHMRGPRTDPAHTNFLPRNPIKRS